MKTAYVFPGQGAQFSGMGRDLFDRSIEARFRFETANRVLGFDLSAIMFEGSDEELKQTKVTQPAVFVHSMAAVAALGVDFKPDMCAGHSLGEFSALVASGVLTYEDGLKLVYERALAMQAACELKPSTMAAVLGLEDAIVEHICSDIQGIVVAANYNCPGQLVISGEVPAIEAAVEKLKEAGAKRALILPVGGAFHSPLMEPAKERLAKAIASTEFKDALCPVYQNASALPNTDAGRIKEQLIEQLTAPVKWTQSVLKMVEDGAGRFVELGPGKVLQGLVKKIAPQVETA